MHFIVKFFPEITIKSRQVRKRFVKQLRDNLRHQIKPLEAGVQVVSDWDKIDVHAPSDCSELTAQVSDILARTPGIASFSRVRLFEFVDLQDTFEKTKAMWGDALAGKTFCVRVKRNGQHDFSSTDAERHIGGGLNQFTEALGVNLSAPEVTVKLEIKRDKLYIVEQQTPGLGGFPLGSQEPVLSLISGGFDSTVSSYLMIKRGLTTHFCFFNLGGSAHEVGVKEVAFYLWDKYSSTQKVKFVTVPFEEVVADILQNVQNSQMGVVLKRMMLRAATHVAQEMRINALVTGEAVAQVSSQTLTNLSVIDSVTNTLVMRPLVVMDKGDIIDISRHIGTEVFAANMPEYCGVISRNPTIRARESKVAEEESNFDFKLLERAVAERQVQNITDVMQGMSVSQAPQIEVTANTNDVIVDIRHPDEQELKPLRIEGVEVVSIPFYTLSKSVAELPASQRYLLYCEKGVMSQLHASHLNDDGYTHIGVYRPDNR